MNRNESDWRGMNFNPKLLPGLEKKNFRFPNFFLQKPFFFYNYIAPYFNVIVHQLIINIRFCTRHCMHTNAAFSTEIERKVSYAAQEESRLDLV